MWRAVATGGALIALLAGCTSSGGPAAPPAPALVEAWRIDSITPIGQPVVVGEMSVGYGTWGQDLILYGLSAAEGTLRWRQAASPSQTLPGIALTPAVIDGRVAYFRPDAAAPLVARLVLASPQTGADLYVSGPLHFFSHPSSCGDDKDVCVRVSDGERTRSYRFSLGSPTPVPEVGGAPPGSRFLGDELLDLGPRDPEMLAGFKDGSVRWRSPLSRHFSSDFTSDVSWIFELYEVEGIHVGSVGSPSDRSGPVANVRDWSKVEMAAIRADDGSPAWRSQGTSFACEAKIQLARKAGVENSEVWPVRCRLRGTGRYERATGRATFEGLDVTIEGFDVATGTTTWSVPLGPASVFMEDGRSAIAVSDVAVLVQGSTGPLIVDLSNGSTRTPAPEDAFWCGRSDLFEYRESRTLRDGTTYNKWRGGTVLFRCGADGSPATAMPASIAPSVGATVNGRTVVAEGNALVAYDRR